MITNTMREGSTIFNAIQIETIQGCTLRCPWCPNKDIEYSFNKMTKELYYKIIDELAGMNFTGRVSPYLMNESLLDDRLEDFIAYTKKKLPDCHIMINTNGTLLDEKREKSLREAGLDEIRVSCYSDEVENKVSKMGVKINKLQQIKASFYNRGGNVDVGGEKKGGYCPKPFNQMYVRWTGQAVLCCSDYHFEAVMGDVNKQSLMDIWNNSKYNKYRQHLKRGKRDLPLCNKCNA